MVSPFIGSLLAGFISTLLIQNIFQDSLKLNKIASSSRINKNVIADDNIIITNNGETSGKVLSSQDEATRSQILIDYIVITQTPAPTPTVKLTSTPRPTPISAGELDALFTKYSNSQSVEKDLLKKIAYCESRFNPDAVYLHYAGLFQYSANSWNAARKGMNLDQNPALRFNPEEAIKTAAFTLATRGTGAWPNCSK